MTLKDIWRSFQQFLTGFHVTQLTQVSPDPQRSIFINFNSKHHNLTAKQSDNIKSLQKQALRITDGDQVFVMPYEYDTLLFLSNIERLQYTKKRQMQERHSLKEYVKKQAV